MLIRFVALALIVVGGAGFFVPFWLRGGEATELPLVEIEDTAATTDRLYFALMSIGRVQVYTRTGAFVGNFPVDNAGGAFCLDIAGDRLTVAVARRDIADTFDLSGRLLERNKPIGEAGYAETCRRDPKIQGLTHALDAVTVAFADGQPPLKLPRLWWHYIAFGPFGSWLLFALGLVLFPEWRRAVWKRLRG